MARWINRLIAQLAEAVISGKARRKKIGEWDGDFRQTMKFYRVPMSDCVSSDGSPYFIFLKRGTTDKTLIHFSGGGLSWDAETAAKPLSIQAILDKEGGYYNAKCGSQSYQSLEGILSVNDARNPVNDWNMVCIPYTTGDLHIGDKDFSYIDKDGSPRILYHRGRRNFERVLELISDILPPPEELVVSGNSAGAFGCVARAPEIAARYPDCGRVTVLSDAAQISFRGFGRILSETWNADSALVDALCDDGEIIRDMFFYADQKLGSRAQYLHFNTIYDHVLCMVENMMNNDKNAFAPPPPDDFFARLQKAVSTLSQRLPNYHYYLSAYGKRKSGHTEHTIILSKQYYEKIGPLSPAEWLAAALDGHAVSIGEEYIVSNV